MSSRLTEKTIGCFKYDLKFHKHETGEFNTYEAFYNYNRAVKHLGEYEEANTLRPIEEWGEDYGDCLWWNSVPEPMYVGNPLCSDFPDYVTHFTRIKKPLNEK